jgi:hypothetical protein
MSGGEAKIVEAGSRKPRAGISKQAARKEGLSVEAGSRKPRAGISKQAARKEGLSLGLESQGKPLGVLRDGSVPLLRSHPIKSHQDRTVPTKPSSERPAKTRPFRISRRSKQLRLAAWRVEKRDSAEGWRQPGHSGHAHLIFLWNRNGCGAFDSARAAGSRTGTHEPS